MNTNYEEEFINNIMVEIQKYVTQENLQSIKNVISSETRKYDFTIIICDYKLKKGIYNYG